MEWRGAARPAAAWPLCLARAQACRGAPHLARGLPGEGMAGDSAARPRAARCCSRRPAACSGYVVLRRACRAGLQRLLTRGVCRCKPMCRKPSSWKTATPCRASLHMRACRACARASARLRCTCCSSGCAGSPVRCACEASNVSKFSDRKLGQALASSAPRLAGGGRWQRGTPSSWPSLTRTGSRAWS